MKSTTYSVVAIFTLVWFALAPQAPDPWPAIPIIVTPAAGPGGTR